MARPRPRPLLTPARLEAEIAAQFAAFRQRFGRAPDYVDGHQHIHVFPQIGEALVAWQRRRRRKPGCANAAARCGTGSHDRKADPRRFEHALSAPGAREPARAPIRPLPAPIVFAPSADFSKLFPEFLDGLPDGGLVMCHPGRVDAELTRLDPLTDLREREYAYFLDERFRVCWRENVGVARWLLNRSPTSPPTLVPTFTRL